MANPLIALSRLTFEAPDQESLTAGVRTLVTPDCRFRLTGRGTDLDGYLDHVTGLRAGITRGELTVLDELTDHTQAPPRAAARVHVRLHLPDGTHSEGEAHLLGTLDGDRIATFHEQGRVLEPTDEHPLGR